MATTTQPASSRLLNRELSWVEFNARVLELAEDDQLPLLERVRFAAIFSKNLDEFFMVRVAGLLELDESDLPVRSVDGLTAGQALAAIRKRVSELDHASGAAVEARARAGARRSGSRDRRHRGLLVP